MMYAMLIGGFVVLLVGAEYMVRGAVSIADKLGVSKLIIGLTVVAFGTSAPEVVVSLQAALDGFPNLAIGNVVGSNIANVLLILGAASMIMAIRTAPHALTRDGSVMILVSLILCGLVVIGYIDRVAAIGLLVLFVAFLGYSFWSEQKGKDPHSEVSEHEAEEVEAIDGPAWKAWLAFLAGLAGILVGSDLLVKGGTEIARIFGVSEEVIGLTLIAFGTSLPELAASVVAAFRGHADVAIGNVVGSNIFNILLVLGVAGVAVPLPVPAQIASFDIWVMLGAAVVLAPFILGKGRAINRGVGVVFLAAYGVYIWAQAVGVETVLAKLG
ncbi:MAG: calcium/sodium antiporter [Rhodospirillales bacterium]